MRLVGSDGLSRRQADTGKRGQYRQKAGGRRYARRPQTTTLM
jgi:hypothetical protein